MIASNLCLQFSWHGTKKETCQPFQLRRHRIQQQHLPLFLLPSWAQYSLWPARPPLCLPLPFLPVKVLPLTSRITYHQLLYVVVFWASVPAPHPLHWHRGGSMAPKTVYTINLHNLLFIKKLFTQCVKKKNKMPVIICVNSKRN